MPTRPATSDQHSISPTLIIGSLVFVAAIVAALAVLGGGDDATPGADPDAVQTAGVQITGSPLPPFGAPDPAVGLTAPTVAATSFDGSLVDFGDDGTARLVGFFAHWCPHCQAELPAVAGWLESTTLPAGVEIVAVSTAVAETGDNYPPSDWFAREAWPAAVVIDDPESTIAASFGLTSFPFWVAINAEGTVIDRRSGTTTPTELAELIDRLAAAP